MIRRIATFLGAAFLGFVIVVGACNSARGTDNYDGDNHIVVPAPSGFRDPIQVVSHNSHYYIDYVRG